MFAVPTYFFIVLMFLLVGSGLVRALIGDLTRCRIPRTTVAGRPARSALFVLLHAFARAAPPSPVSRRSRTASPRSSRSSGRTPAPR